MPSLRMLANSFDSTSRIWCRICTRGRLHLSPLPIQGIHRWGIACSTVNAVGILEEPCLFRSLAMGSSMAQGCTWVASTRHPLSKPEHEVCTFPSPRLFVWLEHVLMSVFRGSSTFVFHSSSLGLETPSSSTSNVATLLSSPPVPFEYSRHRYRSVSFPPIEYSQVEEARRSPAIDVSVSSDGTHDVFAPLKRTRMRLTSGKDGEEGEGSVGRRACEFQRASRRASERKRGR